MLRSGIPRMDEYVALVSSPVFEQVEAYSNAFLDMNSDSLAEYARKWVPDPLHQWSRPWEYVYCLERVREHMLKAPAGGRVFDAGSGVTFVPYLIADQCANTSVFACDSDASFARIYDEINSRMPASVTFKGEPMQATTFGDAFFDVIYTVSALEHTEDYDRAVAEFRRILKPGGLLLVTFDVSLDGRTDLCFEDSESLLKVLSEHMKEIGNPEPACDLEVFCAKYDVLSHQKIVGLIKQTIPGIRFGSNDLSVYCNSYYRHSPGTS